MKKYNNGSAVLWIIGGLVILVGGIVYVVFQNNEQQQKEAAMKEMVNDATDTVSQKAMGVKEEARQMGEEVMDQAVEEGKQKAGETMKEMGENLAGGTGTYQEYSEAQVAENDGALLFFHASWCPSCRTLDESITKESENIPGGLAILKLDYDKETELKKKYAVVGQHTLVQVDKDGNKITMWRGGNSLDEVLAKLQ